MAHPNLQRSGQSTEKRRLRQHFYLGMAILARWRGLNAPAQVVHDELQAIADAEYWQLQLQQFWVGCRRVGIVHRARTARKNQALRRERAHLFERGGAGKHHRKDVEFANATRYQLGVLRS